MRLRGAIMQVIVKRARARPRRRRGDRRPRVHVEEPHVHCEGGFARAELDGLARGGDHLVRWRRHNLFFGGTNAVEVLPDGSLAAAGDARRGGDGVVVWNEMISRGPCGETLPFRARELAELAPRRNASTDKLQQPTRARHAQRGGRQGEQLLLRAGARSRPGPPARSRAVRGAGIRHVDVAVGDASASWREQSRAHVPSSAAS